MRLFPAALLFVAAFLPAAGSEPEDPLRDAATATYIHGMTEAIARAEAGSTAVPQLLDFLRDPGFPRRDNVVAFLAYLGGQETTPELLDLLEAPPAGIERPEEDRALLIAPEALGRIAARGDRRALEVLLRMTERSAGGGPLDAAVATGAYGPAMKRDLERAALRALAFTGSEIARSRLRALAAAPPAGGDRWAAEASAALALFDEQFAEARGASIVVPSALPAGGSAAGAGLAALPAAIPVSPAAIQDTSLRSHENRLSYAVHPDTPLQPTDARIDEVLAEASRRAGTGDYDDDTACCVTVVRTGTMGTLGVTGDGLDVIDTAAEMTAVLQNNVARAKVVRLIQYCGSTGTNIVGCAYTPGYGMALVRLSALGAEAVLWLHEYGHNLGLNHRGDGRFVMYGSNSGSNTLLQADECQTFHQPSATARAVLAEIGTCTPDGDEFADPLDNCPSAANSSQTDADADGVGDACDNCPGVPNPDQGDTNANGIGDACEVCLAGSGADPDGDRICGAADNCPNAANPSQTDFDFDGVGDACETGARLVDVDLSGRVDGHDLARLGRAFASSAASGSAYDAGADFDRNGVVDGLDLALLAAQFGRTAS